LASLPCDVGEDHHIARGVKLGNPRLLAGSPGHARMAAAAKSAKATARATDRLPVIARGPGGRRRHAERDRQGVDGARRTDPERPGRLKSGDGDAAGSPSARLNTRAATITRAL
jgi:hypothetical protein